jgi:hypothetical protein
VVHSIGADVWEVWVCDVVDGHAAIDTDGAATALTRELAPYFSWISDGRYRVEFVAAGTATNTNEDDLFPCRQEVVERSTGESNGAIVITDHTNIPPAFTRLSGRCGADCQTAAHFPANGRVVVVGAHTVLDSSPYYEPKRVAHEIGHAISWPHSFVGRRPGASEYDNPIDVMSGNLVRSGSLAGRPQGTLAVNQYAAGWIDPTQVAVHPWSTTATYRIGATGYRGLRLIVVPGRTGGSFVAIDARVNAGFDTGILREGVTLHLVDQRPEACSFPSPSGCFGHQRRTVPLVGNGAASALSHVLGVGDAVDGPGYRIAVTRRLDDTFLVVIDTTERTGTHPS